MAIDLALAIHKIDPAAEYRLSNAHAQTADDILEWRSTSTPKPTQAQLQAAWKSLEDQQKQQKEQSDATLTQLNAQVGALAGKGFGELKSADAVALLGAILWSIGALDNEGKILPMGEWALRSGENNS